ncbi:GntR family transcriptional regulator [Butyrivibrio sp. MC2013]|uniref:GntR family transcriptional regulator n=1 Tax=Butyrivibrio sp. MC2013 TaxID=1280686 RepID=UPI0003FE234D|nr:GntR family transcriptional regulator [Butyrivibrio sp. MC2013]
MAYEPMYKKIYMDLYNGIQNGQYPPESRLPSEKELSDSYGVSRITSKKALEILADRGYVMRKPGKGTFVLNVKGSTHLDQMDSVDEDERDRAFENDNSIPTTIGVIMDSFGATFGCDLLRGLEYECTRRGFVMQIRLTYGSMENEKKALQDMLSTGVKGLILMCAQGEVYNEDIIKLCFTKFPIMLIDRELKGIPVPVVTTDNFSASCELTQHLIDQGHEKICFLSHSSFETSTINERFRGYLQGMSQNGLVTDQSLWIRDLDVYLPTDEDDSQSEEEVNVLTRLSEYIDSHKDVTAYYAAEYSVAADLYRVLLDKGLEKKKSIVYFDGFDGILDPMQKYDHIIQNQFQMGVTAMRLLAHRMRGEDVTGRENIPYTLIKNNQ